MGFAARAADAYAWQWRGLLTALVAAGFMTAIGAFNTHRLPLPIRLIYWLSLLLAGTAMAIGIMALARRSRLMDDRVWAQAAILTLLLWAPASLMVWIGSGLAFHAPLRLEGLAGLAGPVLVVSAAMTALNYLADRRPAQTHAAAAAAAPPAFLDRLPARLRGAELYAVEAQDHYLRVHTSRGAELILLRLSDAIEELEGIEGARTHRSWWVARDGVDAARRADGRGRLRLKDGTEVPVSRTFARALRAAGWF
jgi:DNA-binding LytR/AlgR family response regulator